MVTRKRFSREFKLEAVKMGHQGRVTGAQRARDLDVHENELRKWVREMRDKPQGVFTGNGKQKAEDAELALLH